MEPDRWKGRAKNLGKAPLINHVSRLLWSHPPALPLPFLRPVIELVIDRQQEDFDAAEDFPIVWQPFAVMVRADWTFTHDPADQSGFFKRLRGSHVSRLEAANGPALWNDPAMRFTGGDKENL